MIVDEVQSAVLEEASAAIRPIEDEEVIHDCSNSWRFTDHFTIKEEFAWWA